MIERELRDEVRGGAELERALRGVRRFQRHQVVPGVVDGGSLVRLLRGWERVVVVDVDADADDDDDVVVAAVVVLLLGSVCVAGKGGKTVDERGLFVFHICVLHASSFTCFSSSHVPYHTSRRSLRDTHDSHQTRFEPQLERPQTTRAIVQKTDIKSYQAYVRLSGRSAKKRVAVPSTSTSFLSANQRVSNCTGPYTTKAMHSWNSLYWAGGCWYLISRPS